MKAAPWAVSLVLHAGLVGALAGWMGTAGRDEPAPTLVALHVEEKPSVEQNPSVSLPAGRVRQTAPSPQEEAVPPVPDPPVSAVPAAALSTPEARESRDDAPAPESPARLIRLDNPIYPRSLRHLGKTGSVTVTCQVDSQGQCQSAVVVVSSGFREMDDRAVQALRDARYEPRRVGGQSVDGTVTIEVQFSLQ